MKSWVLVIALALAGCGAETATTATMKAAQGKSELQAKEALDRAKKDLEKASQQEQERADPLKHGY
jgi:hypothetical protein